MTQIRDYNASRAKAGALRAWRLRLLLVLPIDLYIVTNVLHVQDFWTMFS